MTTASLYSIPAVTGMSQHELAWALNTTQATVSRWLSGQRAPRPEHAARLSRVVDPAMVPFAEMDADHPRGGVVVPEGVWEPAFAPRGRFRLPTHLHWSGTPESRIRDGGSRAHRVNAYRRVLTVGRAIDIVLWVDLIELAATFDDGPWSRRHAAVWRKVLTERGLL